MKVEDIIKSKIKISESGCWEFQGYKNRKGYGIIPYNGKACGVHRVMYMITTGEKLSRDDVIMHRCDNPSCCNPDHLQKGTNRKNTADRHKKGRNAVGENNGNTKITEDDVKKIRELYEPGLMGYRKLAEMFGISRSQVRTIVLRIHWKHLQIGPNEQRKIDGEKTSKKLTGEKNHSSKLTEEEVRRIRELYKPGEMGYIKLGKMFGVNSATIRSVVLRLKWKEVE